MNISASSPINIPQKPKAKKQKALSHSYTSSSSCSSFLEVEELSNSLKLKKSVVLRGAPFYNKETVINLIISCVPSISVSQASTIIEEVEKNSKATIITCSANKAYIYCNNLIENGLLIDIE